MIYIKRWTRASVRADTNTLYIFGDNDLQRGYKGQAVIRGLPNAMGIPTKRIPALFYPNAFYSDAKYDQHCVSIKKAVDLILTAKVQYKHIALPTDGIGTGLAQLEKRAPKVFEYLQEQLKRLND